MTDFDLRSTIEAFVDASPSTISRDELVVLADKVVDRVPDQDLRPLMSRFVVQELLDVVARRERHDRSAITAPDGPTPIPIEPTAPAPRAIGRTPGAVELARDYMDDDRRRRVDRWLAAKVPAPGGGRKEVAQLTLADIDFQLDNRRNVLEGTAVSTAKYLRLRKAMIAAGADVVGDLPADAVAEAMDVEPSLVRRQLAAAFAEAI